MSEDDVQVISSTGSAGHLWQVQPAIQLCGGLGDRR